MALHHTSVADLDATIRCAYTTGHPIPVGTLRASLAAEKSGTGGRSTIIKLLEREIKRQERAIDPVIGKYTRQQADIEAAKGNTPC